MDKISLLQELRKKLIKDNIYFVQIGASDGDTNDIAKHILNEKDMVLFSYADKIYTYCKWPTNFLTYSILHNKKQKQYTDLIENIL